MEIIYFIVALIASFLVLQKLLGFEFATVFSVGIVLITSGLSFYSYLREKNGGIVIQHNAFDYFLIPPISVFSLLSLLVVLSGYLKLKEVIRNKKAHR